MTENSSKIAALNDQFRTSFQGGRVVMTAGINALSENTRAAIFEQVRTFSEFTPDNDPQGEHDFGAIELENVGKIFWKIDYYDLNLQYGSEDPSDPKVTTRVLTIMFASEY